MMELPFTGTRGRRICLAVGAPPPAIRHVLIPALSRQRVQLYSVLEH